MRRGRRSRGLVILVSVIFALLFAEGALVVFVFVSPGAKEDLGDVAESVQRIWDGTERDPGVKTRTARAATRAFDDWIAPLWRGPESPELDPTFTACVECHPDYASERKFSVYMDHPLHAELGMRCETCHPQNPHPNPPRPQESMCVDCHDEVNDKDQCGYCHPPASLPHFYYFGAPRQTVVDCTVCHPRNSFTAKASTPKIFGTHYGTDRGECLSCHQAATCAECHGQPHPPDWQSIHSEGVGYGGGTTCYQCHRTSWCSDRCHAVTSTNVPYPKPLPSTGVRP